MNTRQLLNKLGKIFPKRLAVQNHDYVGLMAGTLPKEINKVLLCLDFDEFVFDYMIKNKIKVDMIITHHPFIYGLKRKVFLYDELKKELYDKVLSEGMCIYSIHTNFDAGKGGMNDTLASMLKLDNIESLEFDKMARGGLLPHPMKPTELAQYIKECLCVNNVRLVIGKDQPIHKVAIIGGGGATHFKAIQKSGYDAYISGDVSHHTRRDVLRYQFNYFDIAHEVERVFMYRMQEILLSFDDSVEAIIVDHEEEIETL